MSRLWPEVRWTDHYVAVITPEGASVIRQRRGIGAACDLKADQPLDHTAGGESATDALAAADALQTLLAHPHIGAGQLTVLLSNHFVRYHLVPWSDAVGPGPMAA